MRVLLTRARDRSEKTARKLERAGHEGIILPLVRYRDTDEKVPAGRFDAVVFTSAEAAASLARRLDEDPPLASLRDLPAFCVGAATADACRAAGFADARSADGDAADLAQLIETSLGGKGAPRLLYPAQPNRSHDLAALLPGFEVCQFLAYDAEPIDPGRAAFRDAVSRCDAVFLYSQRSASHFVDLLLAHGEAAFLPRLTLIAISEKTARAVTAGRANMAGEGELRVVIAAAPDENAMVSLLRGGAGAERPEVPATGVSNDEDDTMTERKGATRRPQKGKTIDLEATELTRAEAAEAAAESMDSPIPAGEAAAPSEGEGESQTAAENAAPVDAVEAAQEATPEPAPAAAEERRPHDEAAPFTPPAVERRGAGPLALVTSAIAGGVIALAGFGALNASGVLGTGAGGAAAPAISAMESELASLREKVTALETAPGAGVDQALVQSLESRIAAVEAEAASLREAVTANAAGGGPAADPALAARIDALESKVSQGAPGSGGADSAVIAQLSGKVDAGLEGVNAAVASAGDKLAAVEGRVGALEQSVGDLKTQVETDAASGKDAARLIAANSLKTAAAEGRPFADLIAPVEALTGPGPQLDILKAQASSGLARASDLLAAFEPAAEAILALDAPKPQGMLEGLLANARSLVKVEPAGPLEGNSNEAIVSRIRAALGTGDLANALVQWESLPEPARNASADWGARLKARVEAGAALESVLGALGQG
jgi:uroporphyrinogen-III synthase